MVLMACVADMCGRGAATLATQTVCPLATRQHLHDKSVHGDARVRADPRGGEPRRQRAAGPTPAAILTQASASALSPTRWAATTTRSTRRGRTYSPAARCSLPALERRKRPAPGVLLPILSPAGPPPCLHGPTCTSAAPQCRSSPERCLERRPGRGPRAQPQRPRKLRSPSVQDLG